MRAAQFESSPLKLISGWTSGALFLFTFFSASRRWKISSLLSAPKHKLSGYSVAGNRGLQHVPQIDALRSCSGEGSCYGDTLPGGSSFFPFFFGWVAVGNQRQGNCLNSEKGGGEYVFPMVWGL